MSDWDGLLSPSGQDLSFDSDRFTPLEVRDYRAPASKPQPVVVERCHPADMRVWRDPYGWTWARCDCRWATDGRDEEAVRAAADEHNRSAT